MAHKVITPPGVVPVISLVDLRAHLRLDALGVPPTHPEDGLILSYLNDARAYAEDFIEAALTPQVWEMAFHGFLADGLELEGGSVAEVVSVTYVDGAGVVQPLAPSGYALDTYAQPNRLWPAIQNSPWPATSPVVNAVRVRYKVGMEPLPGSVRAALLLMVGSAYVNREEITATQTYCLPRGALDLLRPHRRMGA